MARQSSRGDASVKRDVEEALRNDVRVDSDGVEILVQEGAVHLHGLIPSVEQRTVAQRIVERVKGVREVMNQLEVMPLEPRSDVDITADVVSALTRNEMVNERKIEVITADGVVYLRGIVGSHTERRSADDLARSVPGVLDVIDEIVVAVPRARSDEEIAAELKFELERNLCLDEGAVRVEVKRGVVRLQGVAATLPQRWMADELIRFTPGVVDVINDLSVAAEDAS